MKAAKKPGEARPRDRAVVPSAPKPVSVEAKRFGFGWKIWMALLCAFTGMLLYSGTLRYDYTVDDATVIEKNKLTTQGVKAIPELLKTPYRKGFWDRNESLYRPLSVVMFAIEWQFAPHNPHVSHFVNVLIYGLTGFMLFLALDQLWGGRKSFIPLAAALLFVCHPIHTEVVANIKSRDELLALLFVVVSLYFLLRYVHAPRPSMLACSMIGYFAALLSKENAITFVAIVPLALYFFARLPVERIIRLSAAIFAVAAVYLGIRFAVLHGLTNDVRPELINNSLVGAADPQTRFATALYVMGRYVLLLFVPHPLAFDYSYNQIPIVNLADPRALAALAAYAGLGFYVLKTWQRKDAEAFGILFFLVTISLVSNILFLIESTMGERFLYMPSLGFCIALAALFGRFLEPDRVSKQRQIWREALKRHPAAFISLLLVLITFSGKTVVRSADWKNNLTLLQQDVRTSPGSARIRYAYGSAILFEQALRETNASRKDILLTQAIGELERGIKILPTYAEAYFHLGLAYKEKGDFPRAIQNLELARSHKDFKDPGFYVAAGITYGLAKQYDKALAELHSALTLDPKSDEAYSNLGLYYAESGKMDQSIDSLQKAIELNPKSDVAYYNLGNTYAQLGNYVQAISSYQQAIRIKPDYIDAYNNTGNSYAAMKDYTNAISQWQKVLELDPNQAKALNNLSLAYRSLGDNAKADQYLQRARGGTINR